MTDRTDVHTPAATVAEAHRRVRDRLAGAALSGCRVLVLGPDAEADAQALVRAGAREAAAGGPDPLAALRALEEDRPDAVAWLAGPQAPAAAATEVLAALARDGVRIVVALEPSERPVPGTGEPLPSPSTLTPEAQARSLAAAIGGVHLRQRTVAVAGVEGAVPAGLSAVPPGDAVVHVVCANAPPGALETAAAGAETVAGDPRLEHLAALEAANAELRRANTLLAREQLGRFDSAAASILARLEVRARAAERRVEELEQRLELEKRVAFQNDAYFQAARRRLQSPQHRAADKVAAVVLAIPLLGPLLKRLLGSNG